MKKLISALLALVLLTAPCAIANGAQKTDPENLHLDCMTIIVGKDISATGHVIVGHNEDDIGRFVLRHSYVPAAQWPEGSMLPAESGRASIPQVENTYGYYWSQARGVARGASGADTFLNENGVSIVSNNNGDSRENIFDDTRVTDGGLEYNMRRIVAERAGSAREALDLIIEMLDTWGYAPSGRAYTIADSEEAFMIQIVSGRRYIAARVPDNAIVVMPNHYTFHTLSDAPEMFYSEDLVEHAVEMGWYKPAVEGDYSDFDFAKAYQDSESYGRPYNVLRQKYAMDILLGCDWDVAADGLPFLIYPEEKITLESVIASLSTHYEGTEHADTFGPGLSPHDTLTRKICTGSTVEATVFEYTDDPLTTTVWTAFGRPCQLPFIPLHPLAGVTEVIDVVEDPAAEMQQHLSFKAHGTDYMENGWQAMRDFENLHEMVYADEIEGVTALKETLHEGYVADNAKTVADAQALIDQDQMDEAAALLAGADAAAARSAIDALNAHAEANFEIVEIVPADHDFNIYLPDMPYTVTFKCSGKPVEESILFGQAGLNIKNKYAAALSGTLTDLGDHTYAVSFDPFILMSGIETACTLDFTIGGNYEDGSAFAGLTLINFIAD